MLRGCVACITDPLQHTHVHSAPGCFPTKYEDGKGVQHDERLKEGVKYDQGKNRMELIPTYPLWTIGEVYTFGAGKYEDDNWRMGMKWSRVFGAILRHLYKFWRGEEIDDESGLPHLAHAAWGCITLLEYTKTRREFDDRKDKT